MEGSDDWQLYFTLFSNSCRYKSVSDRTVRFAPSIVKRDVTGFGTATTNIPADFAALTPLGESSKTTAASFWTCSQSSANRKRSGFGLVLPGATSSAQMTLSK